MTAEQLHIRPVLAEDASAITAIYNHYIEHSIATFEEELLDRSEMEQRIQKVCKTHPFLVAELHGKLIGYAYATQLKGRSAYRFSAESSIYLSHETQGKGHGTALYKALIEALVSSGIKQVIGGVSLPNPSSIRLHESLGFVYVGTFPKVGWKFNQWIDVGYWQLDLS